MNKIVLEGIDGVGKTTFANKLMNNLSSKGMIVHSDSKTPNTYEWYSELNNKVLKKDVLLHYLEIFRLKLDVINFEMQVRIIIKQKIMVNDDLNVFY
ncbi:hypothetical protein [Spiroplasma kunkelii]|nr:hypothetical protein [Spiroplasma kunkelii]